MASGRARRIRRERERGEGAEGRGVGREREVGNAREEIHSEPLSGYKCIQVPLHVKEFSLLGDVCRNGTLNKYEMYLSPF